MKSLNIKQNRIRRIVRAINRPTIAGTVPDNGPVASEKEMLKKIEYLTEIGATYICVTYINIYLQLANILI